MPTRGRHQLQLRPDEIVVIQTALQRLLKDKSLSPIEKAITESVLTHINNSKLFE